MANFSILFHIAVSLCFFTRLGLGVDDGNLQDVCPASTTLQTIFINGFPCKNPSSVTASDFKSSLLNRPGNTDNFMRSSTRLATAADFSGLNTLGLSIARTDLEVDGIVMPHSHPRSSEMLFVSSGIVVVGFIDSVGRPFQRVLRAGDVFVIPRGLLHYCLNAGFEDAIAFSVLNSQNPGVVSIAGAMFPSNDTEVMKIVARRLISMAKLEVDQVENMSLFDQF